MRRDIDSMDQKVARAFFGHGQGRGLGHELGCDVQVSEGSEIHEDKFMELTSFSDRYDMRFSLTQAAPMEAVGQSSASSLQPLKDPQAYIDPISLLFWLALLNFEESPGFKLDLSNHQ